MTELVRIRVQGTRTCVTLDRPHKGNSLSAEMVHALEAVISRCHEDGTTLLVLDAQGPHFCTGFDLGNLDEATDDALMARFVRIELMLQKLQSAPFITVALGHGRMVGAGADLFVACQRRILVAESSFRFPGAAFGLVLGTGRLARSVGAAAACDWVGSGRWVSQAEALERGLAHTCVDEAGAQALIERLHAESLRLDVETRGAVYAAAGQSLHRDRDLNALVLSASRPGLCERIRAFRAAAQELNDRSVKA
ncbi:enoyl-CoA hydratase/isomerase family protein [Castellaniella sp.]|uniref:enoyl-CoA hydratase/isomerase family protein n=1 Tax=Castellaniella sp. TaxID=1955812 RepID=UPI003C758536